MIIQKIKERLEEHSNAEKARRMRVHWQRLYQEIPELYGVATPIVRQLSSEFFQKILSEVFNAASDEMLGVEEEKRR